MKRCKRCKHYEDSGLSSTDPRLRWGTCTLSLGHGERLFTVTASDPRGVALEVSEDFGCVEYTREAKR
jgi:hypothetical protein